MLGPFNQPNVDDSGFYVPFYVNAFGPSTPGPFVTQFATVVIACGMALAANTGRILSMVVRQGAVQVAVGLAVGLGLSFALATLAGDAIRNTLFGVSGRDPPIYVAVASLVAAVSLAATFVPARRATRVDPMHVLRIE